MRLRFLSGLLSVLLLAACGGQATSPTITPPPTITSASQIEVLATATLDSSTPSEPTAEPTQAAAEPSNEPATPANADPNALVDTSMLTGRIYFVDPLGFAINSIAATGGDLQTVYKEQGPVPLARLGIDPSLQYLSVFKGDFLHIYSLDFQELLRLPTSFEPIWSPNGDGKFALLKLTDMGEIFVDVYDLKSAKPENIVVSTLGYRAAWLSDGSALVVHNGNQIGEASLTDGAFSPLGELVEDENGSWVVDAILSHDDWIYFHGGQVNLLGASGNGMQWWVLLDGVPQVLSEIGGNGVTRAQLNAKREQLAYIDNFHVSACLTAQVLSVQNADFSSAALTPNLGPIADNTGQEIHGATWNPSGDWLTFAKGSYTCADSGPIYATPQVFVWNPTNQALQAFEYGSYPVWVK
ncbi:hypothetical protein [Herpetosiphon giganteus]|uniref:hypothetical protein n=1 Tax=Herpetosiphon giganteus TaxID=2029754 RepID=UPI001956EF25|nr:hypothetical protein [Herpetosiphon giganteus]MBM7845058.1 hypothetical protein [Herpetosiphon giganteus]